MQSSAYDEKERAEFAGFYDAAANSLPNCSPVRIADLRNNKKDTPARAVKYSVPPEPGKPALVTES